MSAVIQVQELNQNRLPKQKKHAAATELKSKIAGETPALARATAKP